MTPEQFRILLGLHSPFATNYLFEFYEKTKGMKHTCHDCKACEKAEKELLSKVSKTERGCKAILNCVMEMKPTMTPFRKEIFTEQHFNDELEELHNEQEYTGCLLTVYNCGKETFKQIGHWTSWNHASKSFVISYLGTDLTPRDRNMLRAIPSGELFHLYESDYGYVIVRNTE